LNTTTSDLAKINDPATRNIVFDKKPHIPIHDKVPVLLILRDNIVANIVLRSNDLVWYNRTKITLFANQSKIVTMYIWIPSFIKPGFIFTSRLRTDNIIAVTPRVSVWPDTILRVKVSDKNNASFIATNDKSRIIEFISNIMGLNISIQILLHTGFIRVRIRHLIAFQMLT
jgi:hypothetical protein